MTSKTCAYCGTGIAFQRAGARFCSTKHRVYAARAAKKNPILPAEMRDSARWMRWKLVPRGGRDTKVPITLAGKNASSTDSTTWATFSDASKSDLGAGLGFALGQGTGCIDLDHCIIDGVVAEWAQVILDRAPATYVEVSQSKTGLHIFGLLPEGPGRNIRRGDSAVEFYSVGRFIAVTGERFGDAPAALADLSGVVASVS